MYCQQCSAQNPDGANFCRVCGAGVRQSLQPAANHAPAAHAGAPRQRHRPGQHLLRALGTVSLSLGLVACALYLTLALLGSSAGLIELIIVLLPVGLGLLLRHLAGGGGGRNWAPPSGQDAAGLAEHRGGKPLSPGYSQATPVLSVTERTTELLDAKKEGRPGT